MQHVYDVLPDGGAAVPLSELYARLPSFEHELIRLAAKRLVAAGVLVVSVDRSRKMDASAVSYRRAPLGRRPRDGRGHRRGR